MKRSTGLLSLVLLAGIFACETREPGLTTGPQLKPVGQTNKAVPFIVIFRDHDSVPGDTLPSDKIRSDDRMDPYYDVPGYDGPFYVDGSCGVVAEIAKGSSAAWFFPSGRPIKGNQRLCGERRRYNILLPDGSSVTGMVVVDGVREVTEQASPQLRWAAFKSELCPFRFTDDYAGLDADLVRVTRIDSETWFVESTNEHRAVCTTESGSTVYHLPFALTFKLKPN
jgi:hypothetical protein